MSLSLRGSVSLFDFEDTLLMLCFGLLPSDFVGVFLPLSVSPGWMDECLLGAALVFPLSSFPEVERDT